jgi:predicted PurR-regulated permease PerM
MESKPLAPSAESGRKWPFPSLNRKVFLGVGLALLFLIFYPFWGIIAVAGVFAFALEPPLRQLTRRYGRHKRRFFVNLTMIGLIFAILLPATFFGLRLFQLFAGGRSEGFGNFMQSQTMSTLREGANRLHGQIIQYGITAQLFDSTADARRSIRDGASVILSRALNILSNMIASIPEFILLLFVFSVFLWLFLAKAGAIRYHTLRLNLVRPRDLHRTVRIMQICSYDMVISNLLVGILQASIITVGAALAGYSDFVLIFTVVFFCSYIPVIGAAPVGALLAVLSLILGDVGGAAILGGFSLLAGVADNVARPYFLSNGDTEVHPVFMLGAILGAIGVFGIKGIFLGPVIVTATFALLDKKRPATQKTGKRKGGIKTQILKFVHKVRAEIEPSRKAG